MRQMISGLVAAAAVMFVATAPAAACGFNPCQPVAPVYSGCNTGCGGYGAGYGGYERLAEPTTQYYYVNQGPTYTGPGAFAPYPTYREDAVVAPANYGYGHGYGYSNGYGNGYGYRAAAVEAPGAYPYRRPYYRPYRYGYGPRAGYLPRTHYGYGPRYGYAQRRYAPAPYYGGHRVLRRYY